MFNQSIKRRSFIEKTEADINGNGAIRKSESGYLRLPLKIRVCTHILIIHIVVPVCGRS